MTPPASVAGSRPNIVVIMADDLGFSDIGCFGAEIATPNIDRIAATGKRFTQMYNNCRCSPTRASLLTGLYPTQTGIGNMAANLGTRPYQGFLNQRCVTLGETLGLAGYQTAISGKWHVAPSHRLNVWPAKRGFDESYCAVGGNGYYTTDQYRNGEMLGMSEDASYHLTDAVAKHSVATIRDFHAQGDPFFLYVAHKAPHFPLHEPEEEIAPYRETYRDGWEDLRRARHRRAVERGVVDGSWTLPDPDPDALSWEEQPNKDWQKERMAAYAAQITHMDRGIGDLLDTLEELGIRDDTIVIFLSDNGACSNELEVRSRAKVPTRNGRPMRTGNNPEIMPGPSDTWQSYGLSWANASNSPFRRFKRWVEEGGIAGPFVISWPGVIEAGQTDAESVLHVMDLMPTFLEVAGGDYPERYADKPIRPTEGESFVDLLTGTAPRAERAVPLFWEHLGHRAVRDGRWKIVDELPTGDGWNLYDMITDRTETNDVAAEHPEIVAGLDEQWQTWKKRVRVRTFHENRGYRPRKQGRKERDNHDLDD
jgi:arylsulfatase A-like enzyme